MGVSLYLVYSVVKTTTLYLISYLVTILYTDTCKTVYNVSRKKNPQHF